MEGEERPGGCGRVSKSRSLTVGQGEKRKRRMRRGDLGRLKAVRHGRQGKSRCEKTMGGQERVRPSCKRNREPGGG